MYAVCSIIGLFASALCGAKLGKKRDIAPDDIIMATLFAAVGATVGGHLLYAALNIKYIAALFGAIGNKSVGEIVSYLSACFGGSVFYGGLFGSLIFVHIYINKTQKDKSQFFKDIFATVIPLFHCFGRIGCFFGGCCFGIESDFGFITYTNTLVPAINGVRRIPVALFEAAGNLGLFFILLLLLKKGKAKLTARYLAMYAPLRFCLEFLRGDTVRGIYYGLSLSQWVSIAVLGCVIVYQAIRFTKKRKI